MSDSIRDTGRSDFVRVLHSVWRRVPIRALVTSLSLLNPAALRSAKGRVIWVGRLGLNVGFRLGLRLL